MSGETEKEVSGWTVDTLHEHMNTTIENVFIVMNDRKEAGDRALLTALQTVKEATEKSEAATEKRFDNVNAFRAQLNDQSRTFMAVDLANSQFEEVRRLINSNDERVRQSREPIFARIQALEGQMIEVRAIKQGSHDNRTDMYLIVGFIATVLTIVATAAVLLNLN